MQPYILHIFVIDSQSNSFRKLQKQALKFCNLFSHAILEYIKFSDYIFLKIMKHMETGQIIDSMNQ